MNFRTLGFLSVTIALTLVINGCKKSTVSKTGAADLDGIYQVSNTLNVSNVMMYTMNGQITDPNIINDFITRKHPDFAGYLVLNATSVQAQFGGDEINFKNKGTQASWSGVLQATGSNSPFEYRVTRKSSAGFVLEAVDTKIFPVPYALPGTRAENLFSNSNASNKLSNCHTVPAAADYPTECTVKSTYPFTIKDDKVYLSMYNCAIISALPGGGSTAYAQGNLPGVFDTEIIMHLVAGDTIAYQNSNVLFTKK